VKRRECRQTADELLIGAHHSIAGGTPRAVERAISTGCRALQIFVKNNSRWIGKEITDVEAREFRRTARAASFSHVVAHASYLINLGSPAAALRALGHIGDPNAVPVVLEFALEGLYLNRRLAKDTDGARTVYGA